MNMNNKLCDNEEIYLRLIEEEYSNQISRKNPSNSHEYIQKFRNDFALKVKQILLEEKREQIDLDVSIITSAEMNIGQKSGYDGTAIYLKYNNNKEELIIISQGSQDFSDWEYNLKSMLSGINLDQARSTYQFVSAVKDKFNLNTRQKLSV